METQGIAMETQGSAMGTLSKATTQHVGVRFDITYWMFSLNDFEDQPAGAPIPNQIPRPQDTLSFMIGLEFMRWR